MTRIALIGVAAAALLVGGCSYSSETNVLGYRTSSSFSTPGAAPAPGYYAAPTPGYNAAPAYSEAPSAYAPPPPVYYAPAPAYYGPSIGISLGRWWGRGRYRRW